MLFLHAQNSLFLLLHTYKAISYLLLFKERELALKFFSTLSGVKTDKMGALGLKLNHDHSDGNCEICDSGKIEEALEALARYED